MNPIPLDFPSSLFKMLTLVTEPYFPKKDLTPLSDVLKSRFFTKISFFPASPFPFPSFLFLSPSCKIISYALNEYEIGKKFKVTKC